MKATIKTTAASTFTAAHIAFRTVIAELNRQADATVAHLNDGTKEGHRAIKSALKSINEEIAMKQKEFWNEHFADKPRTVDVGEFINLYEKDEHAIVAKRRGRFVMVTAEDFVSVKVADMVAYDENIALTNECRLVLNYCSKEEALAMWNHVEIKEEELVPEKPIFKGGKMKRNTNFAYDIYGVTGCCPICHENHGVYNTMSEDSEGGLYCTVCGHEISTDGRIEEGFSYIYVNPFTGDMEPMSFTRKWDIAGAEPVYDAAKLARGYDLAEKLTRKGNKLSIYVDEETNEVKGSLYYAILKNLKHAGNIKSAKKEAEIREWLSGLNNYELEAIANDIHYEAELDTRCGTTKTADDLEFEAAEREYHHCRMFINRNMNTNMTAAKAKAKHLLDCGALDVMNNYKRTYQFYKTDFVSKDYYIAILNGEYDNVFSKDYLSLKQMKRTVNSNFLGYLVRNDKGAYDKYGRYEGKDGTFYINTLIVDKNTVTKVLPIVFFNGEWNVVSNERAANAAVKGYEVLFHKCVLVNNVWYPTVCKADTYPSLMSRIEYTAKKLGYTENIGGHLVDMGLGRMEYVTRMSIDNPEEYARNCRIRVEHKTTCTVAYNGAQWFVIKRLGDECESTFCTSKTELESFVGSCKVKMYDDNMNKLIMSYRQAIEAGRVVAKA